MADKEGENFHLTRTGKAVVRRLIESNRESFLASTQPLGIPAARQSQNIGDCFVICSGVVADDWGVPNDVPVSMDEASRLILDTLLILQDKRPPPREQLCLGLGKLHDCGQQITRIRNPWAIHLHTLDVTVKLRQPAGSYVVSTISMFPVIRLNNHPRLCDTHEKMMEGLLNKVLLSTDFLDNWVIDAYDRLDTRRLQNQTFMICRNNSWTRTFIDPDQDTEVITAFADQSSIFLGTRRVAL